MVKYRIKHTSLVEAFTVWIYDFYRIFGLSKKLNKSSVQTRLAYYLVVYDNKPINLKVN